MHHRATNCISAGIARQIVRCCCVVLVAGTLCAQLSGESLLRVGFSAVDITPDLKRHQVWLAGYGMGRRATGVHDPLYARCVVLEHGHQRVALVSVDLVGLQYPVVQEIRREFDDLLYLLVSSTHNHEGPDVIGIWGRNPFHRGVDDNYLKTVKQRIVQAVRAACDQLQDAAAAFATAEDAELVGDSRRPYVKDGVLRVLCFRAPGDNRLVGLVVQWNCHPESLGSKNTLVTADFPYAAIDCLEKQYHCPVVYFSGALGGLMSPPDGLLKSADGLVLKEGQFPFAEAYGRAVAGLADKAIAAAEPIELIPLSVAPQQVTLPVRNPLYRVFSLMGVLKRPAIAWRENSTRADQRDGIRSADGQSSHPAPRDDTVFAVTTEVACVRLGQLSIAAIPGEIYPELVHGKYQEPVEPHVDFPDAPLEKPVASMMPTDRWMLFGLANDEIGYIIPQRQWDQQPPFAYGLPRGQYGEINSCGHDVAPIIIQALESCVAQLNQQ